MLDQGRPRRKSRLARTAEPAAHASRMTRPNVSEMDGSTTILSFLKTSQSDEDPRAEVLPSEKNVVLKAERVNLPADCFSISFISAGSGQDEHRFRMLPKDFGAPVSRAIPGSLPDRFFPHRAGRIGFWILGKASRAAGPMIHAVSGP